MSQLSANILVDLDSILDTRQGVLSKLLTKEELSEFITSDAYLLREKDEFPEVNMTRYNALYNKRDKLVISNSIVSYVFNIMRIKLVGLLNKTIYNTDIKEINLFVNMYPYKLTKAETDSIIDALFLKLKVHCFIKPLYKTIEDLSPQFLDSNNIDFTFLYDTNKWCNAHLLKLKDTPMTKRTIFMPAIVVNTMTEDIKYKFEKTGFRDSHTLMEYVVSPYLILNYLPVLFYSNVITVSAKLEVLNKKSPI